MSVQDAACAALQARFTAAAAKQTRVQHPASTRNQSAKHKRNTSTERETHAVSKGQTKNRPRTTSIDSEKGGENSQNTNPNEYVKTMMMTPPLSPVKNPHHCSIQTSGRARSPPWGCLLSLTFRGALVLESVFEDHGVCSEVITDCPSPSSEQFMSGVPWFSHFHQPYSWLTGERVLVSCPTLLPFLPSRLTPAGLLFKSWNWHTLWSDSDARSSS